MMTDNTAATRRCCRLPAARSTRKATA